MMFGVVSQFTLGEAVKNAEDRVDITGVVSDMYLALNSCLEN